jgi:bifunctional oligoribonuclease and PAP phosphatase NrnA
MLDYKYYEQFFKLIEESSNILILNSKPDGDSIGASVALQLMLKKLVKKVTSISPQPIPDYLAFLTEKGSIKYADLLAEPLNTYDLVILVDSNDIDRCLPGKTLSFGPYTKLVCIDHHKSTNASRMDLPLIDATAESACGIIIDLFIEYSVASGKDLFDKDSAFLLYAGIVSDTDYFGYANVSKDTFERAAYLLGYGMDIVPIIQQFRESLDIKAFRFIQRNIGKVVINEEKGYAYLKVKKSDLTEEDNLAVVSEATNFINRALLRIINTVDFSFVIREINEKRSSMGLRRHNNGNSVDLSEIAGHFGGGGHAQAAGVVADLGIDDFELEINYYLTKLLSKNSPNKKA